MAIAPAAERYVAGVAVALVTTALSGLAMTMQKIAHRRAQHAHPSTVTGIGTGSAAAPAAKLRYYRHWPWWVGIGLLVCTSLLSLAVFALVGQSVASAFAALTICWNALFASLILGESFARTDILVIFLMLLGTVLVVYFGSQGMNSQTAAFLDLDDILSLLRGQNAVAGCSAFAGLLVIAAAYIAFVEWRLASRRCTDRDVAWRATLFIRCFASGILSGFVGFFSKAVVSIFASATTSIAANLGRWEVYGFIACLVVAVVLQIAVLNTALSRFEAREAVPLYQALVVVCGVVFGWTLYSEAENKSASDIAGFICGIACICGGIATLVFLPPRRPPAAGPGQVRLDASASSTLLVHRARAFSLPPFTSRIVQKTDGEQIVVDRGAGSQLHPVLAVFYDAGVEEARPPTPANITAVPAAQPKSRPGRLVHPPGGIRLDICIPTATVLFAALPMQQSAPARGAAYRKSAAIAAASALVSARAGIEPAVSSHLQPKQAVPPSPPPADAAAMPSLDRLVALLTAATLPFALPPSGTFAVSQDSEEEIVGSAAVATVPLPPSQLQAAVQRKILAAMDRAGGHRRHSSTTSLGRFQAGLRQYASAPFTEVRGVYDGPDPSLWTARGVELSRTELQALMSMAAERRSLLHRERRQLGSLARLPAMSQKMAVARYGHSESAEGEAAGPAMAAPTLPLPLPDATAVTIVGAASLRLQPVLPRREQRIVRGATCGQGEGLGDDGLSESTNVVLGLAGSDSASSPAVEPVITVAQAAPCLEPSLGHCNHGGIDKGTRPLRGGGVEEERRAAQARRELGRQRREQSAVNSQVSTALRWAAAHATCIVAIPLALVQQVRVDVPLLAARLRWHGPGTAGYST